MRELLADKIKETADEIGILIEYPDSLIDMLIAESYGNEGIRRPVNIIKGLIYDAITDKYLEGKVNRRTRVYIEDLDKAYIVENKRQSKDVNNIN